MIKRNLFIAFSLCFAIASLSHATQDDKKDNPSQPKTTTQGGGDKRGGTQTGQTNIQVNKDCEIQ